MIRPQDGIIRGRRIELDHETGLPDGARVSVRVEPHPVPLEERRRLVADLCGAWSADDSIEAIFADIERTRAVSEPRQVNLDAAP